MADRPDLYDDSLERRLYHADPVGSDWPTDEERRQARILGYIGIAVTHLLAFGLGWALGWALT